MRCNKCGTENPDAERFCAGCGHKLQSTRAAEDGETGLAGLRKGRDRLKLLCHQPSAGLGPYIEAWAYVAVLAAGWGTFLALGIMWPLYPLTLGMALLVWLRRI